MESCNHLNELLAEQRKIIERHLDKHKWYQHIDDRQKAVADFIEKYGWVFREAFCDICPNSETCEAYQNYLSEVVLK